MRSVRMAALTMVLVAAPFAGGCATPSTPSVPTVPPAPTADDVITQVHQYIEGQIARDMRSPGMHETFTALFAVLAVEVMETTVDGAEARVRCDIAVTPIVPIPTKAPHVEIFSRIVGHGAKLGPFIVTHNFLFQQSETGWVLLDMLD
jgi:hypothetical protein